MLLKSYRLIGITAILLAALAMTGCDPYKSTANALYNTSVGIDKLETFNEQASKNGVYSPSTAQSINEDIIKALRIKKNANAYFLKINPNSFTPADKSAMYDFAVQLIPLVSDLQQQGVLGIKNPDSQKIFNEIIVTLQTALAVLKGLEGK